MLRSEMPAHVPSSTNPRLLKNVNDVSYEMYMPGQQQRGISHADVYRRRRDLAASTMPNPASVPRPSVLSRTQIPTPPVHHNHPHINPPVMAAQHTSTNPLSQAPPVPQYLPPPPAQALPKSQLSTTAIQRTTNNTTNTYKYAGNNTDNQNQFVPSPPKITHQVHMPVAVHQQSPPQSPVRAVLQGQPHPQHQQQFKEQLKEQQQPRPTSVSTYTTSNPKENNENDKSTGVLSLGDTNYNDQDNQDTTDDIHAISSASSINEQLKKRKYEPQTKSNHRHNVPSTTDSVNGNANANTMPKWSRKTRQLVTNIVAGVVTAIAIFVLLLISNPSFVQQPPPLHVDANLLETSPDIGRVLGYSLIAGVAVGALPYAWKHLKPVAESWAPWRVDT